MRVIYLIETGKELVRWQLKNNLSIYKEEILQKCNLIWTGTAADLVELAYGILETKRINNGDIDLNDFVKRLSIFFSFEVKDCYDTFRAIRRRVDSRTLFLDEMKERLNDRMDDMDNGVFKKKKIR